MKRRIISAEPVGVQEVWDLEVPNFHWYESIGGIRNHNSCSDPNMQQVPDYLRGMIIARPGYKILTLDFSQFEFRAAAGLTNETVLINLFKRREELMPTMTKVASIYNFIDADSFVKSVNSGKTVIQTTERDLVKQFTETDIHTRNSSVILKKGMSEVTGQDRSIGKCVHTSSFLHTNKGIIPVQDLLPKKPKPDTHYPLENLEVMTDTGFQPCPEIYYNGSQSALDILLETGISLICSNKHQFRTISQGVYIWREAQSMEVGNEVFLKCYSFATTKKDKPELVNLLLALEGLKLIDRQLVEPLQYASDSDVKAKKTTWEQLLTNCGFSDFKVKKSTRQRLEQVTIICPELTRIYNDLLSGTLIKQLKDLSDDDVLSYLRSKATGNDQLLELKFPAEFPIIAKYFQQRLLSLGIQTYLSPLVKNERLTLRMYRHNAKLFSSQPSENITNLMPSYLKQKILTKRVDLYSLKDYTLAQAKKDLNTQDYDLLEFLVTNNLRPTKITKITKVEKAELCDVHVPECNTVVYNGIVTHNTLGYAALYGATPVRIQQSLAKEGLYYTLEQCKGFHSGFFDEYSRIRAFIEQTQKQVHNPGYISTYLGRKRFFSLPPKWKARQYEEAKEAAYREAVNFMFQATNADATKRALIILFDLFASYPPDRKPTILLTIHDEIVIECPDEICEEILEISERVMVESGLESVNHSIPIEVSKKLATAWAK